MNHTTLWNLALTILEILQILLYVNVSLNQTLWHSLCETNLDGSIDSGICVMGYLPLIRKDPVNHAHILAVYVNEGLHFSQISRKLYGFLFIFWTGFTSFSVFFYSINHLFLFVRFLMRFHLTQMRFSWSTHYTNVFVFGDFNIHHKDWLTYSCGTDRPGELCCNYSISDDLTQMLNFPTRIPDCDSNSSALLDLFISSDVSICSAMPFATIRKFWSCCCRSFHWLFVNFKSGCLVSSYSLWLFSCRLVWSSW